MIMSEIFNVLRAMPAEDTNNSYFASESPHCLFKGYERLFQSLHSRKDCMVVGHLRGKQLLSKSTREGNKSLESILGIITMYDTVLVHGIGQTNFHFFVKQTSTFTTSTSIF